jgi:uncharacterized membrane protein
VKDPAAFVSVLYHTLNTPGVLKYLGNSFIGILGWLDAGFAPTVYTQLTAFLIVIAFVTATTGDFKRNNILRLTLSLCLFSSALLIYFALLITWNLHPASTIAGVQGRYFFVPAVMLAFAISPNEENRSRINRTLCSFLLTLLLIYSSYATIKLLIYKYYIQ